MNINQPITLEARKVYSSLEKLQNLLRPYSEIAFRAMFIDCDTYENIANAQRHIENAIASVENALAQLAAIDERDKDADD